jgi:transcriptional regulator with XRE-family HTH domain
MAIGATKLNEDQVKRIKTLFEKTKLTDTDIAEMFGVSREHINLIRNGRRWNWETKTSLSRKEIELLNKPVENLTENNKKSSTGILVVWKKVISLLN